MTIQERILDYLAHHPEGVDDDTLTVALDLAQRQQANQRCHRLEAAGILTRRRVEGKIRNFLNSSVPLTSHPTNADLTINERQWFWEGHVQAAVVCRIKMLGYAIKWVAKTETRERGKDIVATGPAGRTVWISAKGYPTGTAKTSPHTQARHWFSHALFDLILWHGEDPSVELALALPDQTTYRKLAGRAHWFLAALETRIYWVHQNGEVTEQEFSKRDP